jgi:glycosyltransferase involved in cell wall biosynthesis
VRYVLITPARNEAANIGRLAACVVAQTHRPVRWLIVNDGSTDSTRHIVKNVAQQHEWIELLDMPERRDRSFAAKAHCINSGYLRLASLDFDVIGNVDADVSFPPHYFAFLMARFAENDRLGVAGTAFCEDGYSSIANSFEGERHVPGGAQLFRRACWEQVGGYLPNRAGGVDWIAVTTARMKGWVTQSFNDCTFFHHRRLGTAERGRLASAFSYGEKDYYLGNAPLWQVFRIIYQLTARPFVLAGLALSAGYASAALRRMPRVVTPELMAFHRAEQMTKLRKVLRGLVLPRRVERLGASS